MPEPLITVTATKGGRASTSEADVIARALLEAGYESEAAKPAAIGCSPEIIGALFALLGGVGTQVAIRLGANLENRTVDAVTEVVTTQLREHMPWRRRRYHEVVIYGPDGEVLKQVKVQADAG